MLDLLSGERHGGSFADGRGQPADPPEVLISFLSHLGKSLGWDWGTGVNVAVHLQRSAARWPDTLALRHGERCLTYGQLAERVSRLAGGMGVAGLEPGDRVGLIQRNGVPLLESLLACFHAGLIAVPLNVRSTSAEVAQIAETARPAAWIFDCDYKLHVEACEPGALRISTAGITGQHTVDSLVSVGEAMAPHDATPETPAWLFFTSGTTGQMKGATLTHRSLQNMISAYLADVRGGEAGSVVLHAAPLTHGSGLYSLPPLTRGATQVIAETSSYDPGHVLDLVEDLKVTDIAFLAPVMLNRLVRAQQEQPRDLTSLENVVYGGAPMYVDDLRQALETLGPVLTQIYGQAEAPVTIACLDRQAHSAALESDPGRLASVGSAYTSVEVAVDTGDGMPSPTGTGEVIVRGDVVMAGYWESPEATSAALRGGWLWTGDIARLDSHGDLYLLDRTKDVVITGGSNVYPREVEEVLLEHAGVAEVAVVGAPDVEWGERVVAVVTIRQGFGQDRPTLADELEALCRERLSAYKVPRRFDWDDDLPKSPYGKILKREVRARYWKDHDRAI